MTLQLESNAPQLAARLAATADQLGQLQPVNERAGVILAAAPAPRRSGLLGASVRADATAQNVTVAAHTRYWTFVHWGAPRRHVKAQPWLLTQLVSRQDQLVELYLQHMRHAIGD